MSAVEINQIHLIVNTGLLLAILVLKAMTYRSVVVLYRETRGLVVVAKGHSLVSHDGLPGPPAARAESPS